MDSKVLFVIVTVIVGGVMVLTSKNQIRSLLLGICFFYIFPVGWIFYHYTGILLVDVPLIAIYVFALAQGRKIKFYIKEISLPMFLFIAWMIIAGFKGLNYGWSLAQVSKWVRAYLLFVALANFAKTPKDFRVALWALLAGFAFESFLGVYQWRRGVLGLEFLGERMWRAEWWRAHATFYVPSFFGNYLIMLLPFVLRLFVFYKPAKKQETYIYATLMLFGLLALYATLGRGPWLAFVATASLMFLYSLFKSKLRPKLKWPIALGILFGAAFTIHYLPKIEAQFGSDREQAAMSRVYLGQVALRLIPDNKLFGTGAGCYELMSPRYVIPIAEYPTEHLSEMVHNTFLLITSENGIPGGILFLWIMLALLLIGAKLMRAQHPLLVNVGIAWVMSLLNILISFVASPDIHAEQILDQIFILGGFTYAAELMQRQIEKQQRLEKVQRRKNLAMQQQQGQQPTVAPNAPRKDDTTTTGLYKLREPPTNQ